MAENFLNRAAEKAEKINKADAASPPSQPVEPVSSTFISQANEQIPSSTPLEPVHVHLEPPHPPNHTALDVAHELPAHADQDRDERLEKSIEARGGVEKYNDLLAAYKKLYDAIQSEEHVEEIMKDILNKEYGTIYLIAFGNRGERGENLKIKTDRMYDYLTKDEELFDSFERLTIRTVFRNVAKYGLVQKPTDQDMQEIYTDAEDKFTTLIHDKSLGSTVEDEEELFPLLPINDFEPVSIGEEKTEPATQTISNQPNQSDDERSTPFPKTLGERIDYELSRFAELYDISMESIFTAEQKEDLNFLMEELEKERAVMQETFPLETETYSLNKKHRNSILNCFTLGILKKNYEVLHLPQEITAEVRGEKTPFSLVDAVISYTESYLHYKYEETYFGDLELLTADDLDLSFDVSDLDEKQ